MPSIRKVYILGKLGKYFRTCPFPPRLTAGHVCRVSSNGYSANTCKIAQKFAECVGFDSRQIFVFPANFPHVRNHFPSSYLPSVESTRKTYVFPATRFSTFLSHSLYPSTSHHSLVNAIFGPDYKFHPSLISLCSFCSLNTIIQTELYMSIGACDIPHATTTNVCSICGLLHMWLRRVHFCSSNKNHLDETVYFQRARF